VSPPRSSLSFDRIAESYDETRGGRRVGNSFADSVVAHVAPPPARIVEIGVGTGLVALPLTERGYTVLGVDLSPKMLAAARDRIGARVAIGDATRAPIATASGDAVVAARVLHVVDDPAALLADAARIVRPSGRIVVILAGMNRTEARSDLDEATRGMHGIMRGPDADTVTALAEGTGALELVERGTTAPLDFEETPRDQAEKIRARSMSRSWETSDEDWNRIAGPVIERLLALPDPDRPRVHRRSQRLLVFARR
jgi:SAM-dependent methyltransferase